MGVGEVCDAKVEMIRLMDLTIKACTGCEACTKLRSKGKPMVCVHKDDHMPFLLDKLLKCDAVILSTPVFILTPPGYLKLIADRVFRHAWGPIKPKVGAVICVGGTDWVNLALPLAKLVLPHKVKIIDQMLVTYAAGPGQVLLDDKAMAKAKRLGRHIGRAMKTPIDDVKYLGEEKGICPLCHSDLLRVRGSFVECPFCDVKGNVELKAGQIRVVFETQELQKTRWGDWGTRHHHDEIRHTHLIYDRNRSEIKKRMKKYITYKVATDPPTL